MDDVLDEISAWAAGLTWDDLPQEVRERAAHALTDSVATMVGGAGAPATRIVSGYATAGSTGPAPVVGTGRTASPRDAAFVNAVAASALDFDDGHYLAGAIHPGSIVVPAALATAGPSGPVRDVLVAQVAGYEVGLRAAHLLWPLHDDSHYHATGTAGAIGAAVAGARALGLDADGVRRAVLIAWVHAPMSTFGLPMIKESIGWGSMTGVAAAELAAAGFMRTPPGYRIPGNSVIPPSPFHARQADSDPFVTSFGSRFETQHTYFKSFAACRYTHAAAAGLAQLMATHGIGPDDIVGIDVRTHEAATFLDERAPRTLETAQYSFPWVLATVAQLGRAGAAEMAESGLDDPRRAALAAKVTLVHAPELDQHYPRRYPSTVAVRTARTVVEGTFIDAPGDPELQMDAAALRDKWLTLMTPSLGAAAPEVVDLLHDPDADIASALSAVWSPFLTGDPA